MMAVFVPRSSTHQSIVLGETNPSMITDVAHFAPSSSAFRMTFSVSNLGPTRVPSAQVSIFWPLRTPGDDNSYYLYPVQTGGDGAVSKMM